MPRIPTTSRRVAALALAAGALAPAALAGASPSTARSSPTPTKVPVFFLVMAEFPGASIQDRQGGIDRRRMPNLYAISRRATYYPNATTNSAITLSSFPSFLSGQLWKGSPPSTRHTVFGLLRRVRETLRPDLRVVVTSATLAAGPVAAALGGCPVIEAAGRMFPVEVVHQGRSPRR